MATQQPASRFLTALFEQIPASHRFYLWTLPGKRTTWYAPDAITQAADDAAQYERQDVYVGVSLSDRDRGAKQRVENNTAAGIVGLWLDIDYLDGAHKKAALPPDEAAAHELVDSLGVKPTALIHSGHGLQAWWLFPEPWIFDSPDDRAQAASLAQRWNLTLRVRAAERSYVIDSTFDLGRVMRLPGTTNWKNGDNPVAVKLLSLTKQRYEPADLEEYFADDQALPMLTGRHTHTVGHLVLNPAAQPDLDKLDALRSNDPKFKASWERTRKDLADDSGSSYDLSLASIAAGVGWTDQEIADLLIAHRRRHHDQPEKALRADYMSRTIAKARDDVARSSASEHLETVREKVDRAVVTGDTRSAQRGRKELLDNVSSLLGITVTRFVRYTQDPPRYRMETPNGAVMIGGADVILSMTKMRSKIAEATAIVVPRFKGPKWDEIAQAIFSACEDEDVGVESTDEGMAYSWLVEYLQDRPVLDDPDEAAVTQVPFRKDGKLYVFGPPFRKWLWLSRGDRVSGGRMGEVLRSFGCEHETINVLVDGARTTRSAWMVPGLDGVLPAPGRRRGHLVSVPPAGGQGPGRGSDAASGR